MTHDIVLVTPAIPQTVFAPQVASLVEMDTLTIQQRKLLLTIDPARSLLPFAHEAADVLATPGLATYSGSPSKPPSGKTSLQKQIYHCLGRTHPVGLHDPVTRHLWGEWVAAEGASDGSWRRVERARQRGIRADPTARDSPEVLVHALRGLSAYHLD